ncbi:MAG: recombinase family protein [Sarcina sp.]
MIFGYTRVSTKAQLENNSLEQQSQEILSKYENAIISKEQFTGTKIDRPILNNVLEQVKKDDMLVVTKLDRLARNTKEGIEIVEKLFDKGVSVHVLNVGLLEDTTMGRFFLTTLLAVAEMERNIIIERTQNGKAIAKQRKDFKEGRPKKYTPKQLNHALSMLSINGGEYSYKQVEEITNISKSTLIREVRKHKTQ